MFLFSGRGCWQEFIKSVVWSHVKLKVAPISQSRALSISQGRAVGVTHFPVGKIGCTWSFYFLNANHYVLSFYILNYVV